VPSLALLEFSTSSVHCSISPDITTHELEKMDCTKWDYLSLTTQANHWSSPLRNSHSLLQVVLQGSENMCISTRLVEESQCFSCKSSPTKNCKGQFSAAVGHALTLRKRSRHRTISCIQDKPVSPSPHENPKPSSNVGMQRSRLLGLMPPAAPQYTSCIKISYSIPTCEGRRRCWRLDERTPKDLGGKTRL
jgi:hypothetical protein